MPRSTVSKQYLQQIEVTLPSRINRTSYLLFYAQLKGALREPIERKLWKPGDQIPVEGDMCKIFNVSRTVLRQALSELEHEGLITRIKGKGTFVASPKIHVSLSAKLTGFYQDMVDRGLNPVTRVLKQEIIPANPTIAENSHQGDRSRFEVELVRVQEKGDKKDPLTFKKLELPSANNIKGFN